MKLSYPLRFFDLFSKIKIGMKPVCIFDLDGTVTKSAAGDQSQLMLHPGLRPAVQKLMEKGGRFVPSTARAKYEVEEAFVGFPKLDMSTNDGYCISRMGKPDLIYGNGHLPDYSRFNSALLDFTNGMENVKVKDMGAYWGLFVDDKHERRADCVEFFARWAFAVSKTGVPVVYHEHPMGLTLEPEDNLGKAGAIDVLFRDDKADAFVISAGDGHNDERALVRAVELGGFGFKVWQGEPRGIPEGTSGQLVDVDDCVGLLKAIADHM